MAEIEWYQIEAAVQTNSPYRAQEPDELDHIRAAKNALIRYVSRLAGIVTSWQLRTCWQTHLALDDVMSNSQGMAMNAKPGAGRSVRLPKLCQMAAYRLPTVTLQASWSGSSSTAIAPYLARLFSTITLTNPGSCSLLGDFSTKLIGLSLAPTCGHEVHNLGSRSQQTFPIIKPNPKIYLESWNSGQL
ncbi:MAG: hypothetical protein P8L31_05620 [Pseudomonadales bacterium]|nr:hypothetical protein [Pseudomonadales bacterium]